MKWSWQDYWLMFLINFSIAVMAILAFGFFAHKAIAANLEYKINSKADTVQVNYMFNSMVLPQNEKLLQKVDTLILLHRK